MKKSTPMPTQTKNAEAIYQPYPETNSDQTHHDYVQYQA